MSIKQDANVQIQQQLQATQDYYNQVILELQQEVARLTSEKAHLSVSNKTYQQLISQQQESNTELTNKIQELEKKALHEKGGNKDGKNKNR